MSPVFSDAHDLAATIEAPLEYKCRQCGHWRLAANFFVSLAGTKHNRKPEQKRVSMCAECRAKHPRRETPAERRARHERSKAEPR